MAEDHSHHHDLDDPDGLTEKEKAAMRWQAIQGFNAAPVSPLAARLGIALICHMDTKKRLCYVGELRLSIELDAHILSIQKAKKQLKKAGLINWTNPGGPRHLSHFSFIWDALLRYSKQADEAAKAAIEKASSERRNHSRSAGMDMPANNSRGAVIKPFQKVQISNSITAKPQFHPSQKNSHHSRGADSITAVGLADIALDITQKDIAHHITPSQANGVVGSTRDSKSSEVKRLLAPQQTEPRRALEGRKQATSQRLTPRRVLLMEFGLDPDLREKIDHLSKHKMKSAADIYNRQGLDAARAYINGQAALGVAP